MNLPTAKSFVRESAAAGVIAAAACVPFSAPATAAPLAGSGAQDVVAQLQAQGYDVQINGDQTEPLSKCIASDVSGLSGSSADGHSGVPAGSTVYVTVSCN